MGRMSRMPSELGSMLEPGERGKENHARVNNHHQDTQRFEVQNSSSPEQTGAAGKPRFTMLEDVDELMPAKPWCDHAESAILPLEETDIAAVHSVFGAQNFSLLLSREEMEVLRSLSRWNPGGGAYDNSANRNTGKGKDIPTRQRPTEVNTVLTLAGGDSRIEIPTAPTKNPKSGTTTPTLDDAEAWASRNYLTRVI